MRALARAGVPRDYLRAKGDWSGVEAWEAVAAELTHPTEGARRRSTTMSYSLDAILASPEDGIKGDIFIRCPNTGQPVPTGLHTGTVVFDTLPKIDMRMHCPACQKYHWWDCTRAWVIESAQPS